jgi:hypothetical protein
LWVSVCDCGVLRQKLGPNFRDYFRGLGDFATSSCENLLLDLELACESTIACRRGLVVLVDEILGFHVDYCCARLRCLRGLHCRNFLATSVFLAPS